MLQSYEGCDYSFFQSKATTDDKYEINADTCTMCKRDVQEYNLPATGLLNPFV